MSSFRRARRPADQRTPHRRQHVSRQFAGYLRTCPALHRVRYCPALTGKVGRQARARSPSRCTGDTAAAQAAYESATRNMQRNPVGPIVGPRLRLAPVALCRLRIATRFCRLRVFDGRVAPAVRQRPNSLRHHLPRRLCRLHRIGLLVQHLLHVGRIGHRAVGVGRIAAQRRNILRLCSLVRYCDRARAHRTACRRALVAVLVLVDHRRDSAGVAHRPRPRRLAGVLQPHTRAYSHAGSTVVGVVFQITEAQRPVVRLFFDSWAVLDITAPVRLVLPLTVISNPPSPARIPACSLTCA